MKIASITVGIAALTLLALACSTTTTTTSTASDTDAGAKDAGKKDASKPTDDEEKDSGATGGTCGDSADQDTCFSCCEEQEPAGSQADLQILTTCICQDSVCGTECGDTICASSPKNADDTCQTCIKDKLEASCKDDYQEKCAKDADCVKFNQCLGDADCANKK